MFRFIVSIILSILPITGFAQESMFGWGNNSSGQSGLFTTENKIIDFDAGPYSSCYVLDNGEVNCLGCANPLENFKQCEPKLIPQGWVMKYGGLRTTEKPFTTVSSSFGATCGINNDGEIECWGCEPNRQNFQCNIPNNAKQVKAKIPDNPITGLRTIDSAEMHSCAILKDGSVSCWGCEQSNDFGQCNPPKINNAVGISTGYKHSCAVLETGSISCWGNNDLDELDTPKRIKNVKRISSGHGYNAIISEDNEMIVWGDYAPKLCKNDKDNLCLPKNNVKTLSASDDYLCVIYNDGNTLCEKTKSDFKENNKYRLAGMKIRTPPVWINDISVKGISVDNGVTIILTDDTLIDEQKTDLLPNKSIMTEAEYMRSRKVLPPSDAFKNADYDFQNHLGIKFKTIKSGNFRMGSCGTWWECLGTGHEIDYVLHDFEKPLHKVKIKYDFQIGVFEVTIGEFRNYVRRSGLNASDYIGLTFGPEYYPMTMISWYDAQDFVKWLNENRPQNDDGFYRLATEAEWEYATRAGTKTVTWQGELLGGTNSANCIDCIEMDDPGIVSVGRFKPNPWGLYDMLGNVDEWVEDCIIEENGYEGVPTDGTALEVINCPYRVSRGASWEYSSGTLRSGWRDFYNPEAKTWEQGFRVVRDIENP